MEDSLQDFAITNNINNYSDEDKEDEIPAKLNLQNFK